MTDELEQIITLEDDEGNTRDFEYEVLEVDDVPYAVLVPVEPEEDEEGTAYLFRIEVDENGEEVLVTVDDDDEWDRVEAYLDEHDLALGDFDDEED